MSYDQGQASKVRELCQRLRPIIGQQADKIWLAHIVENENGKKQIEDYLELMAAKHFFGNLESDSPALLPPTKEAAAGEYPLSDVVYNGKKLYPFGLREDEWLQHVAIFGRSGAGKTNMGFLIIQQLVEKKKPVLIFDWKRNYRDLLNLPGFENTAVYTIGRKIAPFSFNPLVPPTGTNPKTWLKKLIDVLGHAYMLGDGVAFLMQEAIDGVYEKTGVYSGKVEKWPTFQDVLTALKQRENSGREAGWMSSALRALASLCFGEMDTLVNQGNDNIEKLLTQPVILELEALTQSDKVFFAQAMLLWIHHYRMHQASREKFKHAIVIEEAHHLLSNERRSLAGGQSVMELTFREIREFGESLIYLDQHPSQISMPALGNTYCTICFNLKHRTDVSAMSQAMLLKDDEKDVLGNLQIGQAVVRLQGRGAKPFLISVPEFKIQKGSFTDTHVISHMSKLGLLSVRKHPKFDQMYFSDSPSVEQTLEQSFLADIEEFPDSGVAERYKRLGLSVRQGQKIKDDFIEKGLILEQVQATNKGRLKVIRLTEQGELALSELANQQFEAV
jgi:hypothetical protein